MIARLAILGDSTSSWATNLETKGNKMNVAHKIGRLRNRLNRLKRRVKEAAPDRQGQMTDRIRELEDILREKK